MRIFKITRKRLVVLALVASLALVPVMGLKNNAKATWGPVSNRPTYTWANPADHITFDSITNNPVVGDERPFFSGKVITDSGNVVDIIQVNDNDEVSLRVFFHNDAASNLNLVATNTRVQIQLPHTEATTTFALADITADNATPGDIWDTVNFTGARPFTMEYEPGTAQLWNNVFQGLTLSDNIVTSGGTLIGYNSADGRVPGCEQYSGYVTIKVRIHMQPVPVTVTPQFACTLLNADVLPNRKVNASVQYTASGGATFSTATFNWGDGSTPLVTSNTTASYTYANDGTYTINATLTFNTGSTPQTATCSKAITITTTPPVVTAAAPAKPTPPAALPNTGPASTAAIFAGVTSFAGMFHYLWSGRKQRGL